jgi:sarcosine oxidase, subunit beta
MARTADVVVIGGGLHGCSTALHLALRGLRPVLIEKDYAGRHASGVNAGGVRQLARHIAEIPLSIASMALWERIEDLVHDDCGFARRNWPASAPVSRISGSRASRTRS